MSQRQSVHKLRHPWVVWLALCLALLGAVLPTLSHALVWARGDVSQLIEVCTSAGPRWMALPGAPDQAASAKVSAPDPRQPASATVLEHCPFCLLMADRLATPPQPHLGLFLAPGHAVVPTWPPTVFVLAQVIAAAQPRGPPAL